MIPKKLRFLLMAAIFMQLNLSAGFKTYLPSTKREKTFAFLGTILGMGGLYLIFNLYHRYFTDKKPTQNKHDEVKQDYLNYKVLTNDEILKSLNATIIQAEEQYENFKQTIPPLQINNDDFKKGLEKLQTSLGHEKSAFAESLFLLKNMQKFLYEIHEKEIEMNWTDKDYSLHEISILEDLKKVKRTFIEIKSLILKFRNATTVDGQIDVYKEIYKKLENINPDREIITKMYLKESNSHTECSFKVYWRDKEDPFTINGIKTYKLNTKNEEKNNDDSDLYVVSDYNFISKVADFIDRNELGIGFMLENNNINDEKIWSRGGIYKFSDICGQSFKLTEQRSFPVK